MGLLFLLALLFSLLLMGTGAKLGAKAVIAAPSKVNAFLVLLSLAVLLHLIEFLFLYVVNRGKTVGFQSFFALSMALFPSIGYGCSLVLKRWFAKFADYRYAIIGSALNLAAAVLPVSYLLYGEALQVYFAIKLAP